MKRKVLCFLLITGVVVQLGIVVRPFIIRALTLGLGEPVLFETGMDSLFYMIRGHRTVHPKEIHWSLTQDQPSGIPSGHPVYQTFSTNAQGIAQYEGFQAERPTPPNLYISGVMGRCDPIVKFERLWFDDNFWAKGLPPKAEADEYMFSRKFSTQAIIRVWRGYAVVEDLLFDGKPSREYIREAVRLRREAKRAEQK